MNGFVSIFELMQSRKVKSQSTLRILQKGFYSVYLTHQLCTQQIVEGCKSSLFSIASVFHLLLYLIFLHPIHKGYLCYKMIISQNVSFQEQVKNFLFHRKVMYHSQDIQVSAFLNILWFTKSIMTWDMRHGSFLNISFQLQLIKSPNLAN